MPRRRRPAVNCFFVVVVGNFRGFGEGDPKKPRKENWLGMILGFEGDLRVISPKAKKIFGVFLWLLGGFSGCLAEGDPLKPRRELFFVVVVGKFPGLRRGRP